MGRWRAWFVSWQPGSAWPWLVTWQQVFLAAKTAVAAGLARVRQRWGNDPAQWLTVGLALAMSQRLLAEAGRPLDPAEREPA